MATIKLSQKEATFLVALLEADRQTALQLLAAEHFYQPSLLPNAFHSARMGVLNVRLRWSILSEEVFN
jgi:hypothetical protein